MFLWFIIVRFYSSDDTLISISHLLWKYNNISRIFFQFVFDAFNSIVSLYDVCLTLGYINIYSAEISTYCMLLTLLYCCNIHTIFCSVFVKFMSHDIPKIFMVLRDHIETYSLSLQVRIKLIHTKMFTLYSNSVYTDFMLFSLYLVSL